MMLAFFCIKAINELKLTDISVNLMKKNHTLNDRMKI